MLRQVIMCRGDIALTTYKWIPDYSLPWPDFGLAHECRNWESIDQWASERAIDVNDYSLIVHPELGKKLTPQLCVERETDPKFPPRPIFSGGWLEQNKEWYLEVFWTRESYICETDIRMGRFRYRRVNNWLREISVHTPQTISTDIQKFSIGTLKLDLVCR